MRRGQNFSEKSTEDQLYLIGLIALPFLIALCIVFFHFFDASVSDGESGRWIGCIFRAVTGFYCPGCGGTRAMWELFHGHFLRALWFHPFAVYATGMYLAYMISHTAGRLAHRGWGMRFHNWYLFVAAGLLVVNFIGKNILLFCFGIAM